MSWRKRVHNLVSSLTLEEKVAQLGHYKLSDPSKGIGRANSPDIKRLGINGYNYGTECNTGIRQGFPQSIGMAATFNRTVLWHAGRGTGLGLRSTPVFHASTNPDGYRGLSCWSPMINIMRHPLWGRNHEGYGEDPYLSGEMTSAIVKGMQGDDPRYILINAGCKHFAAFDGAANGGAANISGVDWFQTYMPPFKKCFEAGALSTMCTYAKLNGSYGCENPKLLTTYLRDYMQFEGYVVSDQGAIHDPVKAIKAGCDIEDGRGQYAQLLNLTRSAQVSEASLDQALQRLFYVRFRHGEFDPPEIVPYNDDKRYGPAAYDMDFYSNASLQAAQQSIVLLKNVAGFLPLDLKLQQNVAVFGCLWNPRKGQPYADCQAAATAGYSTAPRRTPGPAESLRTVGFNASFVNSSDKAIVTAAARAADVAVVIVGRAGAEGEGKDNRNLTVPADQHSLMMNVLASETPTVLVLFTCNPLDLESIFEMKGVLAVVHAFYPEVWAGRAVADMLAGIVSPAGRMPYSWPRRLVDSGDIGNYTMTGTSKTYRYWRGDKPFDLFPFGYGLSYATFHYSKLSVDSSIAKTCMNITLKVTVANTGTVASDEVVQVYASWKASPSAPQRQLVGFERVRIPEHKSVEVTFIVTPEQLALVKEAVTPDALPTWMAVPVEVEFAVGGQQPDQLVSLSSNVLKTSVKIIGQALPVDDCGPEYSVVV
jgi:beta-glucosidase